MKNTKRLLFVLLVLTLTLALFACGGGDKCKKHVDEDNDGKCDKCGESIEAEAARVLLFDDGLPTFQFVLGDGIPKNVRDAVNDYTNGMDDIGLDIEIVNDTADNIQDCEILIGDVVNRGEKYKYDKYTLGNDGYVFKIVDKKIVITAGSDEMLLSAVEEFIEDVLMYDEDTEDMGTLYMEPTQQVTETTEYDITAVKVNGTDIRGYTIAYDNNKLYKNAAEYIQSAIYAEAGYWLETVTLDKADPAKSIVIKHIDRVAGENGFKISAAASGQLLVECMYDNKLEGAVSSFVTQQLTLANKGELDFTGTVFTTDISFVTYEDYGAKGDGKTDDFEALYAAHTDANLYGQSVKAKDGAKYYIKKNMAIINGKMQATAIPIMTNVDWTGATFIIDDSDLDMFDEYDKAMGYKNIFEVVSDYPVMTITDPAVLAQIASAGINRNTTKIDLGLGYPAMIIPSNDSHKVYRRKGYGGYAGHAMHEVIVLDKDGNVDLTSDAATPIMFEYTNIDSIEVYRLDISPITIKNGTVTHLGNRVDAQYYTAEGVKKEAGYIARGLNVNRSFTTVDGLVHNIENEITPGERASTVTAKDPTGWQSASYNGFFYATRATNVLFKNCTLTGRRYYHVQGTYDFGANTVNKIVLDGCIQQNFWVYYDEANDKIINSSRDVASAQSSMAYLTVGTIRDRMHWGIGGTNFCKNMEYLNSTLSRYDAHAGLYNGKVVNSNVNYLALTGNGEFLVENVEWYAESPGAALFPLRSDYGATWEGNITVKNVKAFVDTSSPTYLFSHTYANWYYGYKTFVPNISIDNLDYYNLSTYNELPAGFEVNLISTTMKSEPALHLSTTSKYVAVYPYLDLDEDGVVDNTDVTYDKNSINDNWNGISVSGNYQNLNPVTPPSYIKIINNDGGYKYIVPRTHGDAATADPGVTLPAGADPNGGFFGATKFIFGTGENDYYIGTNQSGNSTFIFQ